jgi:LacI family transcriptional regulator
MATIKQVAKAAGVSFKTVSRVVNDDNNVSADTRARVLEAITQLGYRPNLIARNMRTRRTHLLGLLADEIAVTPFAVNLIKGAQDAARQRGFMLMIISCDNDLQRTDDAIETLLKRKVEGIIYATMRHEVITLPQHLDEAPTVLANCRSHDARFTSVVPDEEQGGYEATRALLARGRRRIAFINLEPDAAATIGRLQGYRRALAEHGIPYDESLVRHTDVSIDKRDSGSAEMKMILASGAAPDGVFCGNDQIAIGVYETLASAGLRIPDDVSVVGFDNLVLIAAYLRPALTTMALPHYEMGYWAVEHLLDALENPAHSNEQVTLPCPLVVRESI